MPTRIELVALFGETTVKNAENTAQKLRRDLYPATMPQGEAKEKFCKHIPIVLVIAVLLKGVSIS